MKISDLFTMELAQYRLKNNGNLWKIWIIYYCLSETSYCSSFAFFTLILPLTLFEMYRLQLQARTEGEESVHSRRPAPHGRGERQRADVHERRRPQEIQQRQEADQELRFDYQP